jgi:hypothetical protein
VREKGVDDKEGRGEKGGKIEMDHPTKSLDGTT